MTETGSDVEGDSGGSCTCKVGVVSADYDVTDTLLELEARWTAPSDERASVRELTASFNRTLLRRAITESNATSIASDIETIYRQLTGDDVSSGNRTEVKRRLAREGVPVDTVLDDFVSHQSLYLHLTDCRDLSFDADVDGESRVERTSEQLMALRERFVAVTEDKIERLDGSAGLTAGSPTVLVDVNVFCDECGSNYQLAAFLDRGGCDCAAETDE